MAKEIARRLADDGVTWETVVVDENGGGGSQPPIPFVQEADPGAVGEGALWVQTDTDPPTVNVRSAADDQWETIYPPDPPASPTLAAVLNESNDADGNNIENAGDIAMVEAIIGGALNHDGAAVGFYGTTPAARPEVPAVAVVQDVIDALATLGIVTQAAP